MHSFDALQELLVARDASGDLRPETKLVDLALDSLDLLDVMVEVDTLFDITLGDAAYGPDATLHTVATAIENAVASKAP